MNRHQFPFRRTISLSIIIVVSVLLEAKAQQLEPKYYDIGSPILTNIWVDPVNGNDRNDGSSRSQALQTLTAAWSMLPQTVTTTGYKINLVAGDYAYRDQATNTVVGLYLDERHGTYNYPIIIESLDGPLDARLFSALDFRDIKYVYLVGLDFETDPSSDGGGNTIHFASGDHILIKNCRINGFDGITRKPQETLKVNQVQYIYVEDSDIAGAFWFALDYVGVQYGHIQGCKIHDASEDCLLLKGGTAQIRVEDNIIYNAGRFGFSAGQGSGFDFLVTPWLHYEAYDLKFFNNIIHNTNYAGVAVLGGYNILIAYNTLYKIGIDQSGDRTLLTFNLGQRGCNGGENDTCNTHHQLGGWSPGPWSNPPIPYGTEVDCIPNKNVFVYNNILYNPGKDSTVGGHFEIRGPYSGSDQSPSFLQSCNLPMAVLSDDNLQIKANLIWNGSPEKALGLDENSGGQDTNKTCNRAQLLSDNVINSLEPEFVDHPNLNFHPVQSGTIFSAMTFIIPDFIGTDRPLTPPVPVGNLGNTVTRDYDGNHRSISSPPGAFITSSLTAIKEDKKYLVSNYTLEQNYPNPFNPVTTIRFSILGAGFTTLKISDVIGREVATLVSEVYGPGIYAIRWEASRVPSGVYFYRLQGGNFCQTKKLVLLK
jgi:hypothetical protein